MAHRILLVENEPDQLTTYTEALEALKFDVVTATSAEEALERLDQWPDLFAVLSDLDMGKMPGTEFLLQISRLRTLLFRVLMSGRIGTDEDFDAEVQTASQAHIILKKPLSLKLLRQMKQQLLTMLER